MTATTTNNQNLVGRRFTAAIGEPWDFSSEAGENLILGIIVRVKRCEDGDVAFAECSPFEYNGIKINHVVISPRYRGETSLFPKVSANISFLLNGGDITKVAYPPPSDAVSWLIGTVTFGPNYEGTTG
jgi:hypothetical protein